MFYVQTVDFESYTNEMSKEHNYLVVLFCI